MGDHAALHDTGNRRRDLRHFTYGPGENRRPVTAAEPRPKSKVTPVPGTLSGFPDELLSKTPFSSLREKREKITAWKSLTNGVLATEQFVLRPQGYLSDEGSFKARSSHF